MFFRQCLRAPKTMRISTMAKTRMVLGALKQWRWEEHPGGANFPYEVNFPQESECPVEVKACGERSVRAFPYSRPWV